MSRQRPEKSSQCRRLGVMSEARGQSARRWQKAQHRQDVEMSRFFAPPVVADHRKATVNALGYLRVMFTVEDIDDTPVRLGRRGAELVGEVVQYDDTYRLGYIRGPEGILIGLDGVGALPVRPGSVVFDVVTPSRPQARAARRRACGGRPNIRRERPTQPAGVAKAIGFGDLLERYVGRLDRGSGCLQPVALHGLRGRHSGLRGKGTSEVPRADGRAVGESLDRQRFSQVRAHPGDQLLEPSRSPAHLHETRQCG